MVGTADVVVDSVVLVLSDGSVVVDGATVDDVVGVVVVVVDGATVDDVVGSVVVVVDKVVVVVVDVVVVDVVVVVGAGRGAAATHGVENAIGRYIDGFGHASRSMLRALFDTVTTRLPAPSRHGARWAW